MNQFERVYQIDPEREKDHQREKHPSIELSDEEYLKRSRISRDLEEAGFVYREPCKSDPNMPEVLKQKLALAEQLAKENDVIDFRASVPPSIQMEVDMPKLEKAIKKGKNEQNRSKSTKGKPKKANPKSNKAAVANI